MFSNFKFLTNPKVIFGDGNFQEIHSMIPQFLGKNKTLLIVKGSKSLEKSPYWERFERNLHEIDLAPIYYSVDNEPSPEIVNQAVNENHEKNIGLVIGIGGGSVMDAGKAISAMLPINGKVEDYLEGIGNKKPSGEKIPYIAVPTTAGTGSEATKNAVISKPGKNGYKKSLRNEAYIPDIAIVDPVLTMSCPPDLTAYSGLDAFSQLLESFLSTKSNALTDALAFEGLRVFFNVFERAYENGGDLNARSGMSYAAYLSGVTLANAGLGTVHGIAGVIGGYASIPHGAICGTLIEPINRTMLSILSENPEKNIEYLEKYARIGTLITGEPDNIQKNLEAFLNTLSHWTAKMNIPNLSNFGLNADDLTTIAKKANNKNNPVQFSDDEIYSLLSERL